jgi:hypothetical protein
MSTRLRWVALATVVAAGVVSATASGMFTSALARSSPSAGVVPVDVATPDDTDMSSLSYAFPLGAGAPGAAQPATRRTAAPAGRLATPATAQVVNGPVAGMVPMGGVGPATISNGIGCTADNNNCGLPTCATVNSPCGLLNCVATSGCGLGTGIGGIGGLGLSDCFSGLGCGLGGLGLGGLGLGGLGLGGFGLGSCGLLGLSGCGLDGLGLGGLGLGGLGLGDCGLGFGHHHSCDLHLSTRIRTIHVPVIHVSVGHSSHH